MYSQVVEALNQLKKQNEFEPLHILYKISQLRKKKKTLADKLKKLEKQINHSSPNELRLKFKALKELSSEITQTIKDLELKLPSSYEFSHLIKILD
ncbi:MAG: hypothetical protein GF311_15080, partial [Candidatus Lokiarchaeota archaeon]|nr:hypothetical protein [Candidatus Lokiarchaeota archaeon]